MFLFQISAEILYIKHVNSTFLFQGAGVLAYFGMTIPSVPTGMQDPSMCKDLQIISTKVFGAANKKLLRIVHKQSLS